MFLVLAVITVISILVGFGDKISNMLDDVLKDEVNSVVEENKPVNVGGTKGSVEKRKLIDYGSVVNNLSDTPMIRYKNVVQPSGDDLI